MKKFAVGTVLSNTLGLSRTGPIGRILFLSLVLELASACEGPTGPEGPPGKPGEPGVVSRLVFEGELDAVGSVSITLPPEAGTITNPPIVTCYVAYGTVGWVVVGAGGIGLWVLIDRVTHLEVAISQGPSFARYKVIVVY